MPERVRTILAAAKELHQVKLELASIKHNPAPFQTTYNTPVSGLRDLMPTYSDPTPRLSGRYFLTNNLRRPSGPNLTLSGHDCLYNGQCFSHHHRYAANA